MGNMSFQRIKPTIRARRMARLICLCCLLDVPQMRRGRILPCSVANFLRSSLSLKSTLGIPCRNRLRFSSVKKGRLSRWFLFFERNVFFLMGFSLINSSGFKREDYQRRFFPRMVVEPRFQRRVLIAPAGRWFPGRRQFQLFSADQGIEYDRPRRAGGCAFHR